MKAASIIDRMYVMQMISNSRGALKNPGECSFLIIEVFPKFFGVRSLNSSPVVEFVVESWFKSSHRAIMKTLSGRDKSEVLDSEYPLNWS